MREHLEQLLNHTSGIINYFELPAFKRSIAKKDMIWRERDILDMAFNQELIFSPGEDWSYSNTNYFLIKLVIDAILQHHKKQDFNNYM